MAILKTGCISDLAKPDPVLEGDVAAVASSLVLPRAARSPAADVFASFRRTPSQWQRSGGAGYCGSIQPYGFDLKGLQVLGRLD